MKTIYITQEQKKKLKKVIAAQDQVGGKVNAGVMDGVVGMCENVEEDEYELGAEKGDISPYYHVMQEDIENTVDINQIINSTQFKSWFGKSKVVDENGKPLIVYHGSPKFIGNSFNKEYVGKSMNYGESGVFCTTQDMSWAKRFSYPISPGSSIFSVKLDTSKKGDILSGFLKLEHPLDFFHLTEQDWKNIMNMACDTYFEELIKRNPEKWFNDRKEAIIIGNHQLVKFDISNAIKEEYGNFGEQLKRYGYDGYIALMDNKNTAVEYCFIEPNQFKSIYSLAFNPDSDSIYEGRKKVIKNNKGEIVPDKCDKCGGDVVLQIHGEPVYICKDCGKYFGTMPFNLKENVELEISPDEVDLSSFNIKKKLNPKFWVNGHLDSRIRIRLLDISDDFIEYLGIDPDIVKDIIMTGSLANYNWNEKYSDIDLHILLDYSDIDKNINFVKDYFASQKNSWNNEHKDLKIFGFPVEVYVQDINEKHDSSGIYSLEKDKWLREPERSVLSNSKVNKEYIKDKVSEYTEKIDKLIYLYKKYKGDEYKLGKIAKKTDNLWNEIKNSRKKGFEKYNGKEINNQNITFKALRRFGYLDKLYNLKNTIYDTLMSLTNN